MRQKTIQTTITFGALHIPRTDAEVLLAAICRKPREWIIAHPEESVGFVNWHVFKKMIKKRKNGFPLAYLTGKKSFYGRDFYVRLATLIPRPESEQYVPLVKAIISETSTIVDVGTGTGCIPITLAKEKIGNVHIGIDISKKALEVAELNAKKLNATILFLEGNLLEPLQDHAASADHIIITANLPYLTKEEIRSEPSIAHEPILALDGGVNGIEVYEQLLEQVRTYKNHVSSRIDVIMEINPHQVSNMQTLCARILPSGTLTIHKDVCEKDRFVMLTIA